MGRCSKLEEKEKKRRVVGVVRARADDADDDEGVVRDMERYLDELAIEYDNVWDTTPAWYVCLLTYSLAFQMDLSPGRMNATARMWFNKSMVHFFCVYPFWALMGGRLREHNLQDA